MGTKGLGLSKVGIVLGIQEADPEAADEALDIAMLSIEEKHRRPLPAGSQSCCGGGESSRDRNEINQVCHDG